MTPEDAVMRALHRAGLIREPAPPPRTVKQAAGRFGTTPKAQRRAMAEYLAGPGAPKSGKRYRAARREVERWLAGTRRPRPDSPDFDRLRSEAARRSARPRRVAGKRGAGVFLHADIRVSADEREREITTDIDADDVALMIDAAVEGDERGAVDAFENGIAHFFDGHVPELIDVYELDLTLE